MHWLKSAILEKLKAEPVREIWKFFDQKHFFEALCKIATRKNIQNLSQGLPNQGFMQEKVQKGIFYKSLRNSWKNISVLSSFESLKHLEGWIRSS